ncbi:MAG: prepilin-type N-terminal cleavage/methylation domain-containing protein, partial [Limisphaerales bacterium]
MKIKRTPVPKAQPEISQTRSVWYLDSRSSRREEALTLSRLNQPVSLAAQPVSLAAQPVKPSPATLVPKAQPEISQTRSVWNSIQNLFRPERTEGNGGSRSSFQDKYPQSNVSLFRRFNAFTLIELLVVIAIIAILAAILLPVLSVAMTHAKKTQAKLDVNQIANAIDAYESQYSRMPVPSWVLQSGSNNVTYGGTYTSASSTGNSFPPQGDPSWKPGYEGYIWHGGLYVTNNSDVMAVLLDLTNFPNSTQW